jgi:putative hydrolase of the HAD superfamily
VSAAVNAVLFDLGGVLFRYEPERRWQTLASLTGLTPDQVAGRLSRSGFSSACDAGRLRGAAAHLEALRLLGTRMSLDRFVAAWVDAFTPDRDVLALAAAAKQHAAVAILTNNSDLVRRGLETRFADALASFMPRIFSCDLGLTKPDPRVFDRAAALLGDAPERILLVDDSAANTAAAASLGFQVHHHKQATALQAHLSSAGLLR